MSQVYVAGVGTRFPFRARNINSPHTGLIVVSPVTYGAIGVSFAPGATNGMGKTGYAGNPLTFDTTAFSWLVFAVSGTPYPVLLKESDLTNATSLLGDWAVLARIADGQIYKIPQA